MIAPTLLRAVAAGLQGLGLGLLWLGGIPIGAARPVFRAARACIDRAREWDPRLWEREGDPRSRTRETER